MPPDDVAGVLDALECRSFINCLLDTKLQSGGAIDVLQLLITTDRCEIAKRLNFNIKLVISSVCTKMLFCYRRFVPMENGCLEYIW